MEPTESGGSVLPFGRRWHMLREIDLVPLLAEHERLARLCDRLEACADALPALPGPCTRRQICRDLGELASDPRYGAAALLDIGPDPLAGDEPVGAMIGRIRARRAADAAHAQDLVTVLERGSDATAHRPSPDALGYMLRCFFTGCRRALDLEVLALLSMAEHRLTPGALAALVAALERRAA